MLEKLLHLRSHLDDITHTIITRIQMGLILLRRIREIGPTRVAITHIELRRAYQAIRLPANKEAPLYPIEPDCHAHDDDSIDIPRLIHIVWVGDERLCPHALIKTWRDTNPTCRVRVWGNFELSSFNWHNREKIKLLMDTKCYNGVADIMRYEILYWYGGFAVDADSKCLRELPSCFFSNEGFSCFENEIEKPGLLAAGYLASKPRTDFIKTIIQSIAEDEKILSLPAWIKLGPARLTAVYNKLGRKDIRVYPSFFFIPVHHSGRSYRGDKSQVYAEQMWGTTLGCYHEL